MKQVKKLESVKQLFQENKNLKALQILGGGPFNKTKTFLGPTGASGTLDYEDDPTRITL